MQNNCLNEEMLLNKRYRIKRILGSGGFGITYAAEDESLVQSVVIKEYFPRDIVGRNKENQNIVLPGEKNDRKRFLKGKRDFLLEARRMSQLFEVPEVVKILDWFEENGTAYLVMEYVRGITLDKYLQRQDVPLSFQQAWKMLEPAAEALEEVHKKGIIHRDLNPENLMIQEDGRIKIIDFGAARKYLETEKTMTILIKKGYAPPEQYLNKGKQGPWTDVYALCATLYEMITGVRPAPSPERMQKDELYPPSAYGADILPGEEEVLFRGLELDPEKRFRNIKELRQALKPEVHREEEQGRKNFFRILGISMASFLCIIGAAVFFFLISSGDKETEISYAGNYGRQSEKYKEFLQFVDDHAVSEEEGEEDLDYQLYPEQGKGTVYTLDPQAVQEWGEPCNQIRFEKTRDDLLIWMENQGHILEKTGETETDTVKVYPYGAVITEFKKTEVFETEEGLRLMINNDSVNGDLFSVYFEVQDGSIDETEKIMAETAEFLAQEFSPAREEVLAEIRQLENWSQEDGWRSSGFNYWMAVIDGENGEKAWGFGPDKHMLDYPWYYWP